jgi:hypothetical protein
VAGVNDVELGVRKPLVKNLALTGGTTMAPAIICAGVSICGSRRAASYCPNVQ